MIRPIALLTILLTGTALGLESTGPVPGQDDPKPDRYTSCAVLDEGYTLDNALVAKQFVLEKLIPKEGRRIRTNYCYYKVYNATIAGVCNGSARNRTITVDEVARGFNQIQTDCGKDSGYHVVNNLTFSAYGLIGGIKALVPKNFDYPDFPGWSDVPEIVPVKK